MNGGHVVGIAVDVGADGLKQLRRHVSFWPSPSDSRNIATDPTPSRSQSARSQSAGSQTAPLPVEMTVWKLIPRRELSALTATLPLWEIIATGPAGQGLDRVAPDRRVVCERDDSVAVRPADGKRSVERGLAQLTLEFAPALDLAEAGGDHDRAAAPRVGGGLDRCRHMGGGHGDRDRVSRLGQVGEGGEARDVADLVAPRIDAPDRAVEADPLEVAQDDVAVRAGSVSCPHDRDGTRLEQSIELHQHLPGTRCFRS